MAITQRDKEILLWINKHGFVLARQIISKFNINEKVVYRRLKELERLELIKSQRFLFDTPKIYWLTNAGVQTCDSNINCLRKPSLQNIDHDLKLVDIIIWLENKNPNCIVRTSRQIRSVQKREVKNLQALPHIPDAIMHTEQNQVFVIEVELSLKSNNRLKKILLDYKQDLKNNSIQEVLYFCDKKNVKKKIEEIAKSINVSIGVLDI